MDDIANWISCLTKTSISPKEYNHIGHISVKTSFDLRINLVSCSWRCWTSCNDEDNWYSPSSVYSSLIFWFLISLQTIFKSISNTSNETKWSDFSVRIQFAIKILTLLISLKYYLQFKIKRSYFTLKSVSNP